MFSGVATYSKGVLASIFMKAMPQTQFTSDLNVLVIGVDNKAKGSLRSDTMMIANINPYSKHIGVISVPRDSRIPVEGHGKTKTNHAYAFGGINLLRQSLAEYLGIPIPYYVELEIQGLKDIVDEIGGVELNVEKRMYYVDKAGDLYIDLYPGKQVLDGNKAVQYVRFRADARGDIGRVERQQHFIRAFGKKVLQVGFILRVPRIMARFASHVKTNVPSSQVATLALKVREAYELGHLEVATLPGHPQMIGGISYWIPNEQKVPKLINRFIKGYELANEIPLLKHPEQLRVEILNGNGRPDCANSAYQFLAVRRYGILAVKNASHFDYPKTTLVCWNKKRLQTEALLLAKELYLHPSNIVYFEPQQKDKDFSLILGEDWPLKR